jgi:hypothetical protein
VDDSDAEGDAHGGRTAADDAQARFEGVVDELLGSPGVIPPGQTRGFGRGALRYEGKIFAMFVRGHLVVKLPAERVDELAGAGEGVHFDANKGTPMAEWLSLDPGSGQDWLALAREALAYAQLLRGRPARRR